jgi:hypothetical protein
MHTGFWWRNLKERDYLAGAGIDGIVILKRMGGCGLLSSEQILMAGC